MARSHESSSAAPSIRSSSNAPNQDDGLSNLSSPSQIHQHSSDAEAQHDDKSLNSWIRRTKGWRWVVQNFVPGWFAVNMGTGIVSILLRNLPYPYVTTSTDPKTTTVPTWLFWLATAIFVLNVVLFIAILTVNALRYSLYPQTWKLMIQHPAQSLYLGTFPMAFSTIGSMFSTICVGDLGWGGPSGWAEMLGWAFFWIDVIVAAVVALGVFFKMITSQNVALPNQSATMLLPIVAPIVAAAQGSVVAGSLSNPQHALITITVSYISWGIGVPSAMLVLALYFHRLALYKLPPREVIVSVFLPLGPLGQGGYAMLKLGAVAKTVFPMTNTIHPLAGDFLYVLGFFVALILWGFGLVWLCFAVAAVLRSKFPFNVGWWAFTFPLGVYAMSTITMGKEMPSMAFRVVGTIFAFTVILLWIMVFSLTVKHALSSSFFSAPCLREIDGNAGEKEDSEPEQNTADN